jgi:hypothetical protein
MRDGIEKINTSAWVRSTRCGAGNCVELRYTHSHLIIRDSKGDAEAQLRFERDSWSTFLERCHSAYCDQLP